MHFCFIRGCDGSIRHTQPQHATAVNAMAIPVDLWRLGEQSPEGGDRAGKRR
jgi:hypothetical protein